MDADLVFRRMNFWGVSGRCGVLQIREDCWEKIRSRVEMWKRREGEWVL